MPLGENRARLRHGSGVRARTRKANTSSAQAPNGAPDNGEGKGSSSATPRRKAGAATAAAPAVISAALPPLETYPAIAIENVLSFRNAKELWTILEMLNHPAVGAAWDLFNAALIGEPPSVSVPLPLSVSLIF